MSSNCEVRVQPQPGVCVVCCEEKGFARWVHEVVQSEGVLGPDRYEEEAR